MKNIKFSEEWDKLKTENRIIGKHFGTFRAYEARKEQYYFESIGFQHEVILKGTVIGVARLEGYEVKRAKEMNYAEDTYPGWGWKEFSGLMQKFYGNYNPVGIHLQFIWLDVY